MKRIHIALGVRNIAASVKDYSKRLGCRPAVVIPGEYALWRTVCVNFSIRRDPKNAGRLRHLGFEDVRARRFTKSRDVNGVVWEQFSALHQKQEIAELWPKSR